MPLIAYLDESGDPSLDHVDQAFPIFSLALVVVDTEYYATQIVPALYRFKFDTWGHEGIILHSRDIRKGQGAYAFLTDPASRPPFYDRLNAIIAAAQFTVIGVAVRKTAHRCLHGPRARAPYDLALRFAVERLLSLLEACEQRDMIIVAESRTAPENQLLRRSLQRLLARGTGAVAAAQFQAVRFDLVFVPKSANIIGTQLADLVAYPIARYTLHPERANPAFELIVPKLYRRQGESLGLTIYPADPAPSIMLPLSPTTDLR